MLKVLDNTGERGGRPPYDPVVMFRVILLGQWHNLSDNELEQSLRVRLDFMMFSGISLSGAVPDSTTIQDFRMRLVAAGLLGQCLKQLNEELEGLGLKINSGKLVLDSTVIESAARPRNVVTPGDEDGEPPSQSSSADPDARWTKKGQSYYYGYKEHALVDAEDGFVEAVEITPANRHDGQMLEPLLKWKRGIRELLADKAYASRKNRWYLMRRGIRDSILWKATRNNPLSRLELRHNRKISRRRFVVEQQFGTKKARFGFARTRYIGLRAVQGQSQLKAFCFNLLKAVRKVFSVEPLLAA